MDGTRTAGIVRQVAGVDTRAGSVESTPQSALAQHAQPCIAPDRRPGCDHGCDHGCAPPPSAARTELEHALIEIIGGD